QLREAMSRARGEDKQLTQHRKTMEEKIGAKAGPAGGAACLEAMGQQALTMVAEAESPVKAGAASLDDRLKAIPEGMKATIGGQGGTALTKGFAGVVGTSFDAIKQALAEGSINQKAQVLIDFGNSYLKDGLLKEAGPVFEMASANLAKSDVADKIDL